VGALSIWRNSPPCGNDPPMSPPADSPPPDDAERVAAWLRANPDFLAERPELYRTLAPPARIHGENVTDHMAAMLAAERRHARGLAEAMATFTWSGRVGAGLVERAQDAVLALIAATDAVECALHDWPALLGLESVSLAAEDLPPPPLRALPTGTLARLLPGGQAAAVRDHPDDAALLHGEAAALVTRDAVIRVPMPARHLILALAARDEDSLPARGGTGTLAFLGRALAAAILR